MIKEFASHIRQESLCTQSDKILVAVSGGADSVVLLHLLHRAGYNIALAHCNFGLRGKESDADEVFVRQLCAAYQIENHFIAFNTRQTALETRTSIEMAARDLRYKWFHELCDSHHYTKIATGHHLNDSIETIFINLTRGTGLNGIIGIKPRNGKIIRPLLIFSRKQIEDFAEQQALEYRTDSSNLSNEYLRNVIRHEIIPEFKKINPSFEETMRQNMQHFSQAASIFNEQVALTKKDWITQSQSQVKISIDKLLQQTKKQTYLYEVLSPYGFNIDAVKKIIQTAGHESGKIFYSQSHQIVVDREYIIMEEQSTDTPARSILNINDLKNAALPFTASIYNKDTFSMIKNPKVACLDADKVIFPLLLRKWKSGDVFYPLGMRQKKKVSDFYIDQKINRFEKEKIWILESDKNIIWIVGQRIDNRFKVTPETQNILQLTLQ